jgi:hypothetical protein
MNEFTYKFLFFYKGKLSVFLSDQTAPPESKWDQKTEKLLPMKEPKIPK